MSEATKCQKFIPQIKKLERDRLGSTVINAIEPMVKVKTWDDLLSNKDEFSRKAGDEVDRKDILLNDYTKACPTAGLLNMANEAARIRRDLTLGMLPRLCRFVSAYKLNEMHMESLNFDISTAEGKTSAQ